MNFVADGERHLEKNAYPASRSQFFLSLAVVLIPFIVFYMRVTDNRVQGLAALIVACLMVFLILGVSQILGFKKISDGVLNTGRYVTGGGSGETSGRYLLIVLFFALTLLAPFFLSAVLSPSIWLGAVLGMIMGFSVSQLSMIYYVALWEKKNGLRLESYLIWVYDDQDRIKVVERGVVKKN